MCVGGGACSYVFLCLRNIHTYGDYTRTQILHINVGLRLLAYADMHVHSIHVSKATQPTQPTQCNTPNTFTRTHAVSDTQNHTCENPQQTKKKRMNSQTKDQITLSLSHTHCPPPPPPHKHCTSEATSAGGVADSAKPSKRRQACDLRGT